MKVAWIAIAALTVTGCMNGGSNDTTSSASGGGAPTSGSGGDGGAGAGGSMGTAGSSSSSGSGGKNAGTGDWSCLGSQGATSGATVTYGITFVNRATHAPNKGLKVTICETGALITDCVTADPNGDVKAKGTTDDAGKVVLHVPVSNSDGFSGFIHAVDAGGAMIDEKVFVNFVEDQGLTINTFAKADVTALGSALGVDIDLDQNGLLDGVVLDCNYARPSGATITDDQDETVYFLEDGQPSKTAKATDASGEFFIPNAAFAITGLQMANSDGDAITGISVAPNPGVVTTVAVPHTH